MLRNNPDLRAHFVAGSSSIRGGSFRFSEKKSPAHEQD
jgi:hypothetical protein